MVNIKDARLMAIVKEFEGKKIVVVGDLMIDRYFWGKVNRISPEAPVPVVDIESESTHLGGAANVANNIYALKGTPLMVGVVGDDNSANLLMDELKKRHLPTDGIIKDSSRPTTVKTRIIADNQHVVRADRETTHLIDETIQKRLIAVLEKHIRDIDGIILEDYNKGLLTPDLIKTVTDLANKHRKIVTVDPKFDHFLDYQNATVFKPNKRETEQILGRTFKTPRDIEEAGKTLLEKLNCQNVLITLGEDGMALFQEENKIFKTPTRAIEVHDVSGAGDTVISTLTISLASGADIREATTLANYAAGVVCGKVGVQPITPDELVLAVQHHDAEETGK